MSEHHRGEDKKYNIKTTMIKYVFHVKKVRVCMYVKMIIHNIILTYHNIIYIYYECILEL